MKFENAFAGAKKMFIAEILMFVTAVFTLCFTLFAENWSADSEASSGFGVLAVFVVFLVIGAIELVAYVIDLIGVIKAAKDEDYFRGSLYLTIATLLAFIAQGYFTSGDIRNHIFALMGIVLGFGATVYVLRGFISLSEELERPSLAKTGYVLLAILLFVNALQFAAKLLGTIFVSDANAADIAAVFNNVASVVSIVESVIYIVYLKKVMKTLGTKSYSFD